MEHCHLPPLGTSLKSAQRLNKNTILYSSIEKGVFHVERSFSLLGYLECSQLLLPEKVLV